MDRSVGSRRRDLESLRVSMLSKVVESALGQVRQLLLVDLVETYFPLSADQMERYQRLVSRKEYRKVQDVELTWAEKLLEQGREAGLLEGKREAFLQLLTAKFGQLSDLTVKRVQAIDSVEELDQGLQQVLTATSLAEMELG